MRYEGIHCRLAIDRPQAGVIVVTLTGSDIGEFGDAPIKDLDRLLEQSGKVSLFIDARAVKGATIDVSSEWARWLRRRRNRLAVVAMLTGAPFVQLTAKFVQRFAELGEAMRIYADAAAFDAALRESIAEGEKSGSDPDFRS